MNVICRFPSKGPTLQERLLHLLLTQTQGINQVWQNKK